MSKWIPLVWGLSSTIWFWLAWNNLNRGKIGLSALHALAGIVFIIRSIYIWRKENQSD
jgi:hypothetical protein